MLAAVLVVLATLAAVLVVLATLALPARAAPSVELLYFGSDACPYCQRMQVFLDDLEARYGDDLDIQRFEVSGDLAARDRWVREMTARGQEASGVPTAILGDRVWVGFSDEVAVSVDAAVAAAVAAAADADQPATAEPPRTADDPAAAEDQRAADDPDVADDPDAADDPGAEAAGAEVVRIPLFGDIDVGARSALGATVAIAFVDGFNPCSLWVLSVLLAMVLNAGASRGRVALVGGTFLTVTGLIYGAFIAGVFTVLGFIEHLNAIQIAVGVVALVVGAVNVKDYVAYKRGISFTIPDRFKPRIYRGGRMIRDTDRPLAAVLGTTVAMAAGIAVVELPCTAGFPVIWSGILRTQGVEGAAFAGLLGVYLLIYVLDELLLFAAVVVTLRIGRFEERHGRLLKLLAGAVMISLGVVLLVAPQLMEDMLAATLVVGGSVVLAIVIDLVVRRRQPPDPAPPASTRGTRPKAKTPAR
jgi:hypothetical protein